MTTNKNTCVGYQWGTTGAFIGSYEFPNNLDQVGVHLPPNTTLIPPPDVEDGEEAYFSPSANGWLCRDKL